MKNLIVSTAVATCFLAQPALAQNSDAEQALANSFEAEHEAWKEDLDRWDKEHEEAVRLLTQAIEKLSEESALDRHRTRIEDHKATLEDDGLSGLASHHARARSQHEEMREVHHHLMDAVTMVTKSLEEDAGVIGDEAPEMPRQKQEMPPHEE